MTNEDLQQARAQLWRQDGAAVLTGEDAQAWLNAIYFCTLRESPRLMALPSLGAALGGSPQPTRESAKAVDSIAARLVDDHAAALVLWDDVEMLVGAEALPFVFGLAGERELKKPPAGTPLAQEVWREMHNGSKTVAEIARAVGGEVTAGAVRRALQELWRVLRVLPLAAGMSEDVRWEVATEGWAEAVRAGVGMSQVTALSALVTIYLHCAVAATEEEVERVLAPLASRARVQEVMRGLHSARQLQMVGVGHNSYYTLTESAAVELAAAADDRERELLAAARAAAGVAKEVARPAGPKRSEERGPRKEWKPRERGSFAKPGERKPWVKRESGASGGERKPWVKREGAPRSFGKSSGPGQERKPWVKRDGSAAGGERKPWVKREGSASAGGARPWQKREGGAKPFAKRGGPPSDRAKPWQKREGSESAAERKPWIKREGGAKPFAKRSGPGGERKPWVKREGGAKPFAKRSGPGGERKPWVKREGSGASAGGAKPWQKREGGAKPWQKREDSASGGERKPWVKREGSARPFAKRSGPGGERKPWVKREGGANPFAKRSGPGGARAGGSRPAASKPFGRSPGGKPWKNRPSSGKPVAGAKPPRKKKEPEE
jgi:hypothetical protein